MIKIVAKSIVKADSIESFISVAKKLVEETNKNDAGCIAYELFQDVSNPQILTIIEEWESDEALQKHSQAKHFLELIPQIGPLCEKPSELSMYKKL